MSIDSKDSEWSKSVRERDYYKCRLWVIFNGCQIKATEAHHLFTRSYQVIRHNVDNGIAVCWSCHRKIETHPKLLEIYQKIVKREILESLVKILESEGKFIKLNY